MPETLTIGSLFSGYGGLDLAVEQVTGARPAWFVEYDAAPSRILAHHWPDVPNHGDVTKVDWATMPPVDILTGGFPCQPFSAAGMRAGESDERHLWPYVLEAIRALRPNLVFLENVAGLRSIGGLFDEPPLRCVCGWAGRWGGVHYSQIHKVGDRDRHPRPDRHVNESTSCSQSDVLDIRRDINHPESFEPEALTDYDMDGYGRGGGTLLGSRRATPDIEGRASRNRSENRHDQNFPGEDRIEGSLSVDTGESKSVPGSAPEAERTKRTWSGIIDGGDGDAICPACGRPVGDGSGGPVFRSGLGTVYRDLASLGMHVRWTSLRASDIGAPHHRERLFILATPADADRRESGERSEPHEVGRRSGCAEQARVGNCGSGRRSAATDAEDDGRDELDDSAVRNEARSGWLRDSPGGDRRETSAHPGGVGSEEGRQPVPGAEEVPGTDYRIGALPPGRHAGHADTDGERRDGRGAAPEQEDRAHAPTDRHSAGIDWGPYAPAVRHWERLTRPAPAPTELNRNGKPRLNAAFAEWMMGLPEGHITQVPGVSRADQLKAIGNGVCVPQGIAAIHQLLTSPAPAGHFS